MPGPDVEVNARAPAQPAPSTMPMEAISSSAWMTATFFFFVTGSTRRSSQKSMKHSQSEDDGVIGYQAHTVAPPKTQPRAAAEFPSTMIFPAVAFMRSTRKGILAGKFFAAYSRPSFTALMFRSMAFCLPLSCFAMAFSISAGSIPMRSATTPT